MCWFDVHNNKFVMPNLQTIAVSDQFDESCTLIAIKKITATESCAVSNFPACASFRVIVACKKTSWKIVSLELRVLYENKIKMLDKTIKHTTHLSQIEFPTLITVCGCLFFAINCYAKDYTRLLRSSTKLKRDCMHIWQ